MKRTDAAITADDGWMAGAIRPAASAPAGEGGPESLSVPEPESATVPESVTVPKSVPVPKSAAVLSPKLDPTLVEAAIARGTRGKNKFHGLALRETGKGWMRALGVVNTLAAAQAGVVAPVNTRSGFSK